MITGESFRSSSGVCILEECTDVGLSFSGLESIIATSSGGIAGCDMALLELVLA